MIRKNICYNKKISKSYQKNKFATNILQKVTKKWWYATNIIDKIYIVRW